MKFFKDSKLLNHMKPFFILFLAILLFSCNDAKKETANEKKSVNTSESTSEKDYEDRFIERRNKILEEAVEKSEKKAAQQTKSADDWFWKNDLYTTVAVENNIIPGWEGGIAELAIAYFTKTKMAYLKMGTVSVDGTIEIVFPTSVPTTFSMESEIGRQGFFGDINDRSVFQFTNKETGVFQSKELIVMRNGKSIGNLTMGNSVRVTHNLRDQAAISSGDEGYILFWVYAKDACTLKANQDWTGDVRKDGTKTMNITTNVNYNLNFKPGWNFVKSEVIGNYQLEHERGLDVSWFKTHKHTVVNQMPADAVYYYRS